MKPFLSPVHAVFCFLSFPLLWFNFRMASSLLYLSILALTLQIVLSATVVINRGDNVNGDNDEAPSTRRPSDPPIHHQFAVVSSRLSSKKPTPAEPIKEVEEPTEVEDSEDEENEDEDEDEAEGRSISFGKKRVKQRKFQQAVSCGYFRMRPGQAYSIQSTNFGSGGTYRNSEQCTWKFFGQQCKVKASCPCFGLPNTPSCRGDQLKVTDLYSFAFKFCGDSKPQGIYDSVTNNLRVSFRSDGDSINSGTGFLCYVTCTGYGKSDPPQLTYSCPTSEMSAAASQ